MTLYRVRVNEQVSHVYMVWAHSPQEAEELFDCGQDHFVTHENTASTHYAVDSVEEIHDERVNWHPQAIGNCTEGA